MDSLGIITHFFVQNGLKTIQMLKDGQNYGKCTVPLGGQWTKTVK